MFMMIQFEDLHVLFYIYKVFFCAIAIRRDVPVGVPLDLSTPTGMSCIGIYGENCKSDNVSRYCVLIVAFLILWYENWCHGKIQ